MERKQPILSAVSMARVQKSAGGVDPDWGAGGAAGEGGVSDAMASEDCGGGMMALMAHHNWHNFDDTQHYKLRNQHFRDLL